MRSLRVCLKWFFILAPILVLYGIVKGELGIGEGLISEVFFLGVLFCWFYFGTGKQKRCPFCKKRHALKMVKSEVMSKEDVSVLAEAKIRNSQRDTTGSVEQYIPGVKTTYKEYYTCKYCGKTSTQMRTEKKAKL